MYFNLKALLKSLSINFFLLFCKNLPLIYTYFQFIAKDLWKRRFFEEKKKTAPLADVYKELRNEYEALV